MPWGRWGGVPCQVQLEGGTLARGGTLAGGGGTLAGGLPWLGGYPGRGGTQLGQHVGSTCYTAGGMPLAFTQEDFLVLHKIGVFLQLQNSFFRFHILNLNFYQIKI